MNRAGQSQGHAIIDDVARMLRIFEDELGRYARGGALACPAKYPANAKPSSQAWSLESSLFVTKPPAAFY
jgi:hypothetical protein